MRKNLRTQFQTRQYMLSRDFEIFYYSDRDLRSVAPHRHDYYEFYIFLEGNVSIHANGRDWDLSPGDLIIIPPGTEHHPVIHDTEAPYRRFVFWISVDYMDSLCAVSPAYSYPISLTDSVNGRHVFHFQETAFHMIEGRAITLIEEIHADRFGKEARIPLCVSDLLLTISRCLYEMQHAITPIEQENLYDRVVLYIENHLEDELTLDELAKKCFVSKYHISHLFRENMGYSVHQYITKKRLGMCRDAILEGTGVNEACTLYGFRDYSSFYRAFVKEYGISPKKYREAFLKDSGLLKK